MVPLTFTLSLYGGGVKLGIDNLYTHKGGTSTLIFPLIMVTVTFGILYPVAEKSYSLAGA